MKQKMSPCTHRAARWWRQRACRGHWASRPPRWARWELRWWWSPRCRWSTEWLRWNAPVWRACLSSAPGRRSWRRKMMSGRHRINTWWELSTDVLMFCPLTLSQRLLELFYTCKDFIDFIQERRMCVEREILSKMWSNHHTVEFVKSI